jgi:hypothetical protein
MCQKTCIKIIELFLLILECDMGKAVGFGLLTIIAVWAATIVMGAILFLGLLVALAIGGLIYYVILVFEAEPESQGKMFLALVLPAVIYLVVGKISWSVGLPHAIAGGDDFYGGMMDMGGLAVYALAHSFLIPAAVTFAASGAYAKQKRYGYSNYNPRDIATAACVLAALSALPGGGIDYWLHLPNGNYA